MTHDKTQTTKQPWVIHTFTENSYEISRKGNYASGCICTCANWSHAKMIINALNEKEARDVKK